VPQFADLQARLGYTFGDIDLLRLALTHPSVGHEQGGSIQNNQRLEFLGDSVLQLVLSHELYAKFPDASEGPLTKGRARLVNRDALASQSRRLKLGEELILSRGEELNHGRKRPSTLADVYEALIGAVYLDGGFDAARVLILAEFQHRLGEVDVLPVLGNPKGELQEILQAISSDQPLYDMISVSGPDHDREFECAVYYRGEELGRGNGKSKKAAESDSAANALENWKRSHDTSG